MQQEKYSLKVLVDGIAGKSYEILLSTPIYNRYCAVVSVDGLSVMTGRRAALLEDSGYLVGGSLPDSTIKISGFRLNDWQVAAFVFASDDLPDAELMDTPSDLGVIAAVLYVERESIRETGWSEELPFFAMRICDPVRDTSELNFRTISGDILESRAEPITFQRGEVVARICLQYASREALLRAGINLL
ncbi:MAG: hypothetical protein BWY75_00078 [bacterium ADurb.Bin425]|nr:MAG: hypothetical protein BWY75_00078 [bacterium ADurb.Bin425]